MTSIFRASVSKITDVPCPVQTSDSSPRDDRATLCTYAGGIYGAQASELSTLLAIILPLKDYLVCNDAAFARYVRCIWDIRMPAGQEHGDSAEEATFHWRRLAANLGYFPGLRYVIEVDVRPKRGIAEGPLFKNHFYLKWLGSRDGRFGLHAARRFEPSTIVGFLTGVVVKEEAGTANVVEEDGCRTVRIRNNNKEFIRLWMTTDMAHSKYKPGFGLQFMTTAEHGNNVTVLSNGCVLTTRRIEAHAEMFCSWRIQHKHEHS